MRQQNIVFRVDASLEIGTGHLMRCLTLADSLREKGAVCRFVCRPHDGNLIEQTRQRGYETLALPVCEGYIASKRTGQPAHAGWLGTDWATDAQQTRASLGSDGVDWLIVDHYALDGRWEREMASVCARIMVIDDLADREHECDVLLDQNLGRIPSDYTGLVPSSCNVLVGAKYALLRGDFASMRTYSLARRQQPKLGTILVTMGGVDKGNATAAVLDALVDCSLPPDCRVVVLMGPYAPWLDVVHAKAAAMPCNTAVLVNATNVAELMADSDLSIGAAGSTSWERCVVGLPTFMLTLASNQREASAALREAGAVEGFELGVDFKSSFIAAISRLNEEPWRLRRMSEFSSRVCDGEGTARVRSILLDWQDED